MLINTTSGHKFTSESLLLIYSETYRPEKAGTLEYFPKDLPYLAQLLVLLTSFLGLPNNRRKSNKLTLLDVFKNMIDWDIEDEKKGKFSILDKVLAIPMFLYYLIRMIIKIPFSIAKIFTEFLPGIGEEYCRIAMQEAETSSFKYYAAKLSYGFFSVLHFIGRAITSPIKGVLAGAEVGSKSLMVLSLLTTGVVYGALGAVALGLTAPLLIALPLALLIQKLVSIGIGVGAASAVSIAMVTFIQLSTEENIVKLLFKRISNAISPAKTANDTATNVSSTAARVFEVIPPDTNKKSPTSTQASMQVTHPQASMVSNSNQNRVESPSKKINRRASI